MRQYSYDRPIVMRSRRSACCDARVAVASLAVASGCSKADTAPPVATVVVHAEQDARAARQPGRADLPVRRRAQREDRRRLPRVRPRRCDDDGQPLWNDDHDPPMPTSQWKPGQTDPVHAHALRAGVRRTSARRRSRSASTRTTSGCRCRGRTPADRESTSARLQGRRRSSSLPQSENIFVIYKSGWHPAEFAPDDPDARVAVDAEVRGPHASRTRGRTSRSTSSTTRGPTCFADQPQQVTVYAGEQAVATFAADSGDAVLQTHSDHRGPARRRPRWPSSGSRSTARSCPPSCPAAGSDARELGIRVYHAFVEAR